MRWRLFGTEEDREFWENCLKENPDTWSLIEEASRLVGSVRLNRYKLTEQDSCIIFNKIQAKIARKNKKKRVLYYSLTSAASIILATALYFVFLGKDYADGNTAAEEYAALPDGNEIVLIFGNNQAAAFDEDKEFRYDEHGNIVIIGDGRTIGQSISAGKGKVFINKLIVPKGKRSSLTLTDGTKIWVNSGSVLEYPPVFSGETREVSIEGEVFINAATDEKKPFIVNTSDFTVKVLGTRFNVSAYEEDESHYVVLAEGRVEVDTGDKTIELEPEQMATVSQNEIRTDKVNVYHYISWIDGVFDFKSAKLSSIMVKLSRYYDVNIVCDERIRDKKCTGKLVLFDSVEAVLDVISNTMDIEYEISGNDIYLK